MANQPLRICHLGKFYPPATGGIETHVRTLARAQAELGMDVHVVCVNHLDAKGQDVTWSAFAATETVEEFDGPVRVTRLGRRASLARLEFCFGLPRLLAELHHSGVDLLHLHTPNPTMLLGLAALLPQVPLVVTHHSDVIKQKLLRLAVRPFEQRVLRRAAAILSTSPVYPDCSAVLQAYRDKVDALPLGIDLAPFLEPSLNSREHSRRLTAEHGKPLWLAIGRLVYYKGLHNAIQALAATPGKLMIIGHGPLENELRKLALDVGVHDRVIWRDRVDEGELVGAYHAATALWFPSNEKSEGFGQVQVEAMACGCPVINSAIPGSGVAWVSRDGETGLTTPVNDPPALARAALRLLEEPGLRARLAAGARDRAVSEFDQALMAERSLKVYEQALRTVFDRAESDRPALPPSRSVPLIEQPCMQAVEENNPMERSRLRVLHLCSGKLYGGIETLLVTVARHRDLCAEMEPSYALCFEGRLHDELSACGAPVWLLGHVRVSRPWTVWRARRQLRDLLRRERFDLVVCHTCWPHVLFARVVRGLNVPLVFWAHDVPAGRHWLERWAKRTAPDLVLANSQLTQSAVGKVFHWGRSEILYYPVAASVLPEKRQVRRQVRDALGTCNETTVIVQTSRLEGWKGHHLLLDALGQLADVPGWECWIAGGAQRVHEQQYLTVLMQKANGLGVSDRVRFLGQRKDVPELLAAADIHCQPNLGPEPFGIAFIEALYAGLPVVTTAIGAAVEIVEDDCGVLVPPADAARLAEVLNQLIEDRQRRRGLGNAGPERARRLCDPANQLARLSRLLNKVVGKEAVACTAPWS